MAKIRCKTHHVTTRLNLSTLLLCQYHLLPSVSDQKCFRTLFTWNREKKEHLVHRKYFRLQLYDNKKYPVQHKSFDKSRNNNSISPHASSPNGHSISRQVINLQNPKNKILPLSHPTEHMPTNQPTNHNRTKDHNRTQA